MHRTWLTSAWAAGLTACLVAPHADAVTVTTDVLGGNDGSVAYTARNQVGGNPVASSWGSATSGTTGSVIGLAGSSGSRTTNVFVMTFRLPELPSGMEVDAAQLDVFLESVLNAPGYNVDLWGLGYSSSAALVTGTVSPNTTGYFNDVNGDGDPGEGAAVEFSDTTDLGAAYGIASRVKLADNVITPSSTPSSSVPFTATGLAAFIQSLYDAGAVGGDEGDFAILRLSPDADVNSGAGSVRYEMFTNNDDPASGAVSPALTITFAPVPEPASVGLLGLGALALGMRRRA